MASKDLLKSFDILTSKIFIFQSDLERNFFLKCLNVVILAILDLFIFFIFEVIFDKPKLFQLLVCVFEV